MSVLMVLAVVGLAALGGFFAELCGLDALTMPEEPTRADRLWIVSEAVLAVFCLVWAVVMGLSA